MPDIRLVVTLSDLHVGSTVGIMPPVLTSGEGNEINANPVQQWFWHCWLEAAEWIKQLAGDDPFLLVLNGDLIDGNHHQTTQILTPDAGEQPGWALEVLQPVTSQAAKIAVVSGTESHVRNAERYIGRALGAVTNPAAKGAAKYCWDRFECEAGGKLLVAMHHIGATSRPYLEASQLSIRLGVERQERQRAGHRVPDVLCFGHRHRHGFYSDGCAMVSVCGAWQALTRFGHKVVGSATCQPSIAAFDWRGVGDGELPAYRHKLWTPAEAPRIEL